jgi:hypothetical protein
MRGQTTNAAPAGRLPRAKAHRGSQDAVRQPQMPNLRRTKVRSGVDFRGEMRQSFVVPAELWTIPGARTVSTSGG